MKITHSKKSITASTSTRDRIGYLEEQIAELEDRINNSDYDDPEELIDAKLALDELKDELSFAWQDDEAEYMEAYRAQEFNPDGSLKGYDDYYDDTCCSTEVTASSEWASDWSNRFYEDGARYYVMSVPSGTARVLPDDVDSTTYHAEIKFRNGETVKSESFTHYVDAMTWVEETLFNDTYTTASTDVECDTDETAEDGWQHLYNSEFREWYYKLETDKGYAIVEWEDNDGDGYYRCYVNYPDKKQDRASKYPLDAAKKWVEDILCCSDVMSSTSIEAAELVDNDKIQVGLQYNNDGHRFEVKSISKDGKQCKVTEEWISEDTGKEVKKTYTYVIESDADGREYMYDPNYADYKDEWWCKKYAQGADNYPFDWDMRSNQLDKHYAEANKHKDEQLTLGEALDAMQASADAGDEYRSVKVIVDDNQTIYNGYSLEEARNKLKDYLDYDAKYHWVDYDITIWLYSKEPEYEEDYYTPSATNGDYSPSNPWDAPGMSIHDFI